MTEYVVTLSNGEEKTLYSLSAVKIILKYDKDAKAFGYRIYSNGDWVPLGEVKLKGSNAIKLNTHKSYNY